MPESRTSTLSCWMPRVFHGVLVVSLLIAVGLRVYGYFAMSESTAEVPDQRKVPAADFSLRGTAAEAYQQQDWQRAAEAYAEIFEREPDNYRACMRWAHSLLASGQYDAALAALLPCGKFDGGVRRWALYNMACVYAVKGEKRLALDYLAEAVDAGFRTDEPISEDPDLKSLVADPEFQRLAELIKPASLRDVCRRFDFLVGQWNLMGDLGQRIGSLNVEQVSAGYAMRGQYVDDMRRTRTVFAYYEPEIGNWKQLWVDERGNIIHLQGAESEDSSIVLTGHLTTADGLQKPARATFTDMDTRVVHLQLAVTSDAGVTWDPLFGGRLVACKGPESNLPEVPAEESP